jgi:hypothetical protein
MGACISGVPAPDLQSRYVFYPKDETPYSSEIMFITCLANCTVSQEEDKNLQFPPSTFLTLSRGNMLSFVGTTHNPSLYQVPNYTMT